MKSIILVCLMLVTVYAKDDLYTTKYDDIDVDEILANKRLTMFYSDCLLKLVPDALNNECRRCSQKQKDATEKVLRHLAKNYRDIWNALIAEFDKEGKHRAQYKKYIDELEA
ncbi:hypothetical protein RI129_008180 [Pyrocoelia pectoralis]|uniref:Uncharacterized protein n=1 Tax=Pyrocoelia pectoralis TaxID=417401 RepID=A0AAN7V869_9COLE